VVSRSFAPLLGGIDEIKNTIKFRRTSFGGSTVPGDPQRVLKKTKMRKRGVSGSGSGTKTGFTSSSSAIGTKPGISQANQSKSFLLGETLTTEPDEMNVNPVVREKKGEVP